jgi:hypothetical protein
LASVRPDVVPDFICKQQQRFVAAPFFIESDDQDLHILEMGNAMTREFFSAAELKVDFGVHGHFYDVDGIASESVSCRSVLEIARHGFLAANPTALPNAVVIMMNPGSSKPVSGLPEKLGRNQLPLTSKLLVPTRPDTTQYQIMRVMHFCRWDYVRVLNLSDLREAKSSIFAKRFRALEAEHQYGEHSIFSNPRKLELTAALRRTPNAPIICAWGTSPRLDPLIQQCVLALGRRISLIGLETERGSKRYFHPLPALQIDQRAWVTDMITLLAP